MTQGFKKLVILCLLMLTAACQTVPDRKPEGDQQDKSSPNDTSAQVWSDNEAYFSERFATIGDIGDWSLRAKVGIVLPKQREQASLIWRYSEQANQVRLFGPLGIGAVTLNFDQSGAQLTDNKGRSHQGVSAQALLTRIIGWPIPVEALAYWLFALPQPSGEYQYQLNEFGELAELKQFGWQISYKSYSDPAHDSGLSLARKITARRAAPDGQTVLVRLIAKSWQL